MLGSGSRRKEIVTILAAALIAVAAALFFAPLVPAVNNFANTPNATTIPLQACIAPFREGQNIREVFQGTIATNCRTRQGKYGYGTFWAVSQKIDEKITKTGKIRIWHSSHKAQVSTAGRYSLSMRMDISIKTT